MIICLEQWSSVRTKISHSTMPGRETRLDGSFKISFEVYYIGEWQSGSLTTLVPCGIYDFFIAIGVIFYKLRNIY